MNDLIEYYKELIKFRQINEGISKEEVGNRINTLNKIIDRMSNDKPSRIDSRQLTDMKKMLAKLYKIHAYMKGNK
jgi:ribosome-binding protein aMBF1 (putative translation factor)